MFRAYEEPAGQSIHCLAPIVSALAALLSAALVVVHARDLAAALLTVDGWTTRVTYWPRLLGATLLGVVLTPAVLGRLIKFPATPTLPCVYIVAAAPARPAAPCSSCGRVRSARVCGARPGSRRFMGVCSPWCSASFAAGAGRRRRVTAAPPGQP